MPVIPFNPLQVVTGLALQNRIKFKEQQFLVPVAFELPSTGEKFTFPTDPLISVSHKNNIICRNVLKQDTSIRGTVKEKWNMNDYDITITGILIGDNNTCVEDYIIELRKYIEADENINIICPYINDTYDITRIVIESCDYAFTKGEENQTFAIKCKSDDERINLLA